jgi:hypothetical protein
VKSKMIPFIVDVTTLPLPRAETLAIHSAISQALVRFDAAQVPQPESRAPIGSWEAVVERNLAAIADLRDGWDGHGSLRIKPALLWQADRLLKDALQSVGGLRAPYIIPSVDGGIQLEWRTTQFELEFMLGATGSRHFWLRNRNTGGEIEDEGDAATQLLFKWTKSVAGMDMARNPVSSETKTSTLFLAA